MTDAGGFNQLTVRELLATHEAVLSTLSARGVMRTNDAPAGQYAEWLAQQIFGGTLERNSTKSHDLTTLDGARVQVKCRVVRRGDAGERMLSPFRSFEFDTALIILFDPAYEVRRAAQLTAAQVQELSKWRAHVNGRILIARDSVLDVGIDMTSMFRER